jgi:hypothetical protein
LLKLPVIRDKSVAQNTKPFMNEILIPWKLLTGGGKSKTPWYLYLMDSPV